MSGGAPVRLVGVRYFAVSHRSFIRLACNNADGNGHHVASPITLHCSTAPKNTLVHQKQRYAQSTDCRLMCGSLGAPSYMGALLESVCRDRATAVAVAPLCRSYHPLAAFFLTASRLAPAPSQFLHTIFCLMPQGIRRFGHA